MRSQAHIVLIAHAYQQSEKKSSSLKKEFSLILEAYIFENMNLHRLPSQIAGRLTVDFPGCTAMRISFKTIYRKVLNGFVRAENVHRHFLHTTSKPRSILLENCFKQLYISLR